MMLIEVSWCEDAGGAADDAHASPPPPPPLSLPTTPIGPGAEFSHSLFKRNTVLVCCVFVFSLVVPLLRWVALFFYVYYSTAVLLVQSIGGEINFPAFCFLPLGRSELVRKDRGSDKVNLSAFWETASYSQFFSLAVTDLVIQLGIAGTLSGYSFAAMWQNLENLTTCT